MIIGCLSNSISVSLVCKLLNLFSNLKCVLVTRQMVLDMVDQNCTQGDGFNNLHQVGVTWSKFTSLAR